MAGSVQSRSSRKPNTPTQTKHTDHLKSSSSFTSVLRLAALHRAIDHHNTMVSTKRHVRAILALLHHLEALSLQLVYSNCHHGFTPTRFLRLASAAFPASKLRGKVGAGGNALGISRSGSPRIIISMVSAYARSNTGRDLLSG